MSAASSLARLRVNVQGCASVVIIAGGVVLWWISAFDPAAMPVWGPWQFSWPVWLCTAFPLWWYLHGLSRTADRRPSVLRRVAFFTGVGLIYGVLQTRFEYLSQHMFFLTRLQHVAMHHLGPFLVALGWPGATIARGMPPALRRIAAAKPVRGVLAVLQQPLIAACLFVGLIWLWLVPQVQFPAMLNAHLYALMNASMVIDGLLFWTLVLDPRPKPPARTGYGMRMTLAIGVMIPQMFSGALLTFYPRDLYPFYKLCGSLFPWISPLADQRIGGLIIWIPPTMMSTIAFLVVLNYLLSEQDAVVDGTSQG